VGAAVELLKAQFDAALPKGAGIERRPMFGCPAAFVNGRLFACLRNGVIVRLSEPDRDRAMRESAAIPFVAMGRRMREYVVLPEVLLMDGSTLAGWLRRGLAYTRALPPKSKKSLSAGSQR
jgi:hypothetical protein